MAFESMKIEDKNAKIVRIHTKNLAKSSSFGVLIQVKILFDH